MKYEITITKVEEVTVTKNGPWTVVDTVPWTTSNMGDETLYGGVQQFLECNPLKEIKGYAPSVQVTETVRTEVLKQSVDQLDLAAVIKAVNNL